MLTALRAHAGAGLRPHTLPAGQSVLLGEPCMEEVALHVTSALRWLLPAAAAAASMALSVTALLERT